MRNNPELGDKRKMSRREFLKLLAAGTGGVFLLMEAPSFVNKLMGKEALTLALPENVAPVDTTKVISALNSNVRLGKSDYLPDLLNLVQSNRKQVTGASIQQKMSDNFEVQGVNLNVELRVIDGLALMHGMRGRFVHSLDDKPSYALLDADLKPAEAVNVIDHELVHAAWGRGELRAYLHNLRDTTYMIGQSPELLMNGKDTSPLISLLHEFTTNGDLEAKFMPGYSDPFLDSSQVIFEQGVPSGQTLPQAVDFIFVQGNDADKTYDSRYLEAKKNGGAGYVDLLQKNTASAVNLYLQSINPNISV